MREGGISVTASAKIQLAFLSKVQASKPQMNREREDHGHWLTAYHERLSVHGIHVQNEQYAILKSSVIHPPKAKKSLSLQNRFISDIYQIKVSLSPSSHTSPGAILAPPSSEHLHCTPDPPR